jgi:hypothetical protein
MNGNAEELELNDRLNLIESMIAEGRRTCENYGWTFLLWGVAYYVAIAWSSLCHFGPAWPITMSIALVVMGVIVWGKRNKNSSRAVTTLSRAIWSIWIGVGISMFVILDAIGFSGRLTDWRISTAIASTLIGTANAASSLALRWKAQFACAVVWWATTVVCCFGTEKQSSIAFLTAIFLCQIVFGIYLMIGEARARRQEASLA